MQACVCVIIPAYNAGATIARAVASALAEPEVAEVFVVDDASGDDTVARARGADDGSDRLRVIALAANGGPSPARNAAIDASVSPFLAILDADDYLLPGRFARLLARSDWDLIADNILFVLEGSEDSAAPPSGGDRHRTLTLGEFVERNISRPGRPRAELGFLKPLIRRVMLDTLGLRYQEDIRLGEDYLLYAEALARGARFELAEACGYVAIERAGSLSGRHSTDDLARLLAADRRLAARPGITPGDRKILASHVAALDIKHAHRRFLDDKRDDGLVRALIPLLGHPVRLAEVAGAIIRDKRAPLPVKARSLRTLFAAGEFDHLG
ncbi:glycosyltransferase family 2 protein [Sphingomonas sp. MMS12-HWE2-04]|uniref:glycosyltransferase family 2 protein n=1 Tax=Sphingomonas sp. MMS12-HWE2-04 TaxID=3234199 RepID=UPI0038511156